MKTPTVLLICALLIASAAAYGKQPGERQLEVLRRQQVAIKADGSTGTAAVAVLAAGCFWGVELAFARLPGVLKTEVGYTGGTVASPTYQLVSRGTTMHAEAVRVTYDSSVLTLNDLLSVFWDVHDPTTLNRQGNDVGTQYRSAIFFATDDERTVAERAIAAESARLGRNVATTVEPLGEFTPAEEYHRACRTSAPRVVHRAPGLRLTSHARSRHARARLCMCARQRPTWRGAASRIAKATRRPSGATAERSPERMSMA